MVTRKISLRVGNGIELLGVLAAIYLLVLASQAANLYLMFSMYLVSWGCFIFFPHCLMHYLVGSAVGIRFKHYFLGRSGVSKLGLPLLSVLAGRALVLGLRVDPKSLNSVSAGRRVIMFVSGAVASMILPFIVLVAALPHLPFLMTAFLLLLSVGNLGFDFYYSPKAGDISRAIAAR